MVWWEDGRDRNFKCGQQNPHIQTIQVSCDMGLTKVKG